MDDPNPDDAAHVAPLRIEKSKRRTSGTSVQQARSHGRHHSRGKQSVGSSRSRRSEDITPPPTPSESQNLQLLIDNGDVLPFMRAFYPFYPPHAPESATVTLPLNIGDVLLIHSVHSNGWADGTMLSSGARGWLPSNYCDFYDPMPMHVLLRAALRVYENFCGSDAESTNAQPTIAGVVAGVRSLLDQALCLTRDSPSVQADSSVRKWRKLLLAELSGLVKAGKMLSGSEDCPEADSEGIPDQIVLWTFRAVCRGVKFLEAWETHNSEAHQSVVDEYYADMDVEDAGVPPTPPADSSGQSMSSGASLHESDGIAGTYSPPQLPARDHEGFSGASADRQEPRPDSSQTHSQTPRGRVSGAPYHYAATSDSNSISEEPRNALALLNKTHDILLTHVGSYIGRLHGQARFTPQLELAQHQVIVACQDLLHVVEAIYEKDHYRGKALAAAKSAMYERISSLVAVSRHVLSDRAEDAEDDDAGPVLPDGAGGLIEAATACVRDAGECLSKGRYVLERVGDFKVGEWGDFAVGLGITGDQTAEQTISTVSEAPQEVPREVRPDSMPPPPTPDKVPPPLPPKEGSPTMKTLPQLPVPSPLQQSNSEESVTTIVPASEETAPAEATEEAPRRASAKSVLSPLPILTPLLVQDGLRRGSISRPHDIDVSQKSARADSISAASNSTLETNITRSSEFSSNSTRATTPEPPLSATTVATPILNSGLMAHGASQISLLSSSGASTGGVSEHAEDLCYNKEGQITGGTLPALVEKLTVHDSTPDTIFVSAFYLTFRLFTTPKVFAEALVERYDSVANTPAVSQPVRLRVFNAFKQWLESNWRHDCDHVALDVIRNFAETRLREVFPLAATRLQELAEKVSKVEGPVVPRLVSGMSKTTTASATWAAPVAPPTITKAQISLLKSLNSAPTILDFDVLEIARQLTLKESRMFCAIRPEELLAQEWTKKSGSVAANVLSMSALSTDLAHFVAETILDVQDVKKRAIIIKHWIKIADRCLELSNYDSLMAIMCTMNTSTIVRLKKTWELVTPKTKAVLENLRSVIDVSKNHAVLRSRIRNHVPPCLPFLGTYLTDLTFIDVGNPSKRPVSADGSTKQLINFDKHIKTARIISELQRFQIPYRIAEVPELQKWIDAQLDRVHNSKAADVQHLYRRSLLLEPRENQLAKTFPPVPAPPQPPVPSLKEGSAKSDVFAWAHVFKTGPVNK